MILRMASIALALMLVAVPAHAQDNGSRQGQGQGGKVDDPFDIFNPTSLQDGNSPPPQGGNSAPGGVFDAAAGRTGQATGQTQPGGPVVDDDAPPADSQAELEWANEQEKVVTPPDDVRREIDSRIATDISEPAQRYGQELGDLQQRSQRDPQGAARTASELVRAADAEFPDLSEVPDAVGSARGEMDDVTASMTGRERELGPDRPASGTAPRRDPSEPYSDPFRDDYFGGSSSGSGGGYGANDPYGTYAENNFEPIHYPARGTPDRGMSWWQQLLIKSLEGVAEGLKGLSERRANELKARNEKIRRNYPEYRAYVDYESRRAIERSAFSRAGGYDKRLDGLILGPARTTGSGTTTTAGTSTSRPDLSSLGATSRTSRPVARLPRVRDPVTGEEKLIIDMPLGVDAVRPLR